MNNELYHHGVKGQKWGVRRNLNNSGGSSGGSSRTSTKEKRQIPKKVKVGAAVAASVLAAYGVHKVINNPEVISAGKNAVSKMMSTMDTSKLSESVKSSTEYKLAKGAAKAVKPVVSTTGKVIKKIGSDDTTKTITGIGTMAGTAALLKQQRNELRDIKKTEGTNFDKTVKYIQKTSDMGANVSNLAKGPKGQPAGVNNSQNGNKNNSNSNPLLKKTRDLKSVVGDPKGMFGAEDEKNYQNLFRNNPTDDQRALIKAMRKNGYSVDQIKSYVYHSGIGWHMNMNDELYHYGVKGQKWGVRRYQNADGSLTAKGVKKYSKEYKKATAKLAEEHARNTKHIGLGLNRLSLAAYNETADDFNNGRTDKYNRRYSEKHPGKTNFFQDPLYEETYNQMFDSMWNMAYNKTYKQSILQNPNYKKAKKLVEDYKLDQYDEGIKREHEKWQNEVSIKTRHKL